MKIRLAQIYANSIVDGPGIRYAIYTQGCLHDCKGCHNPGTHALNQGYLMDTQAIIDEIKGKPHLNKITFSGGEPLLQVKAINEIIEGLEPNYQIIVYTGFTYEFLISSAGGNTHLMRLLHQIDYLIDGKFILEQRDLTLLYRGSKNQRIIDVKQSLSKRKVITTEIMHNNSSV